MSAGRLKLENPVLVGVIGAAQGLRGEVRVKPYTADPMAIGAFEVLFSADGQRFEVLSIRPARTVVILRFRGVNDRMAADVLKGIELFIDRSMLPDDDLEEDEYFHADLQGLEVVDAAGRSWGVVSAVFDFGGGDLLEIKTPGRRPAVIPFTLAAVLEVDIVNGRILVDPSAAGLIDDGSTPEPDEDSDGPSQ